MVTRYNGFQSLLYHKFITSKQHDARTIAALMNIPASSFYEWIEGRCQFPPDLIGLLDRVTGDRDFIDFIMRDTNLIAQERPVNGEATPCLKSETLDIAGAVGRAAHLVNQALADNHVDHHEAGAIDQALTAIMREAEEARSALRITSNAPVLKAVKR